ncbi:MAG: 30S ribosomal protein S3 [Candidatus Uhrbacteria bacterium]|nr:30S ribosomal protein S3 [Candidatus Uhrbacteria bacterium]
MGHKVHPKIFRINTTTTWPSRWFAREDAYRSHLRQDLAIRQFLMTELKIAAVNRIDIERSRGQVIVTVHTAKPGLVIGRSGEGIETLKKKFMKKFFPMSAKTVQVSLNVVEVGRPMLESALVAQGVVTDLERRMPFRRVLKFAIERVKKGGALGVKIAVSGRLNGAEIARREWLAWGKIPLTNLRADIDYAQVSAQTMAGTIGVKVWIYRGDVFAQDRLNQYQPTTPTRRDGRFGGRGAGAGAGRGPRRDFDRAPAPVSAVAEPSVPAEAPTPPSPAA